MSEKRGFLKEFNKNRTLFLMIAPTLLYFIIFSYIPRIGVYYAFTNFNFDGGLFGSEFVGFKNFEFHMGERSGRGLGLGNRRRWHLCGSEY